MVKIFDRLFPKGNDWMTKAECESVIKKCNEELEKNPNDESVLRKKIQACIHLENSAKQRGDFGLGDNAKVMAAKCYHKLIDNFPTKEILREAAEFFEHRYKGHEVAVRCYDKLLQMDPDHIGNLFKKAAVLKHDPIGDGRKEAAKIYDVILKIQPDNQEALREQADTYNMIGKKNEELKCYEILLKLNPYDMHVLVQTARTLYVLDRHENALAVCEKILEMYQSGPNPFEEGYQAVKIKEMIMHTGKNEEGFPTCPKCKSEDTGYFSFGPPRPFDDDEKEMAQKGRIRMGGCVVGPNTPTLFCNKCGYEWGTMIL